MHDKTLTRLAALSLPFFISDSLSLSCCGRQFFGRIKVIVLSRRIDAGVIAFSVGKDKLIRVLLAVDRSICFFSFKMYRFFRSRSRVIQYSIGIVAGKIQCFNKQ